MKLSVWFSGKTMSLNQLTKLYEIDFWFFFSPLSELSIFPSFFFPVVSQQPNKAFVSFDEVY